MMGESFSGIMANFLELLRAYVKYDPAATGIWEVLLLYPGVKAWVLHRFAHFFYRCHIPILPRLLCETGRFLTGIEIHPGATIGKRVIFDHGMGIVIGETAVVGDDSILYQGVSLGGTSLERKKRHPTIESHVVIGAGAKLLGNIVVGSGSRIGANSVVIESVPPGSTVVGIPGRVIRRPIEKGKELSHNDLLGGFDASI